MQPAGISTLPLVLLCKYFCGLVSLFSRRHDVIRRRRRYSSLTECNDAVVTFWPGCINISIVPIASVP